MGYIQQWDISKLIDKLEDFDREVEENKGLHTAEHLYEFKKTLKQFERVSYDKKGNLKQKSFKKTPSKVSTEDDESNTFMTEAMLKASKDVAQADEGPEEEYEKDVVLVHRWKAHTDGITSLTFNNDPVFIASSSFDKNVYIWSEN